MYTTTLDKKVTKYCKKFGIKKVTYGNDFSYIPDFKAITYTMFITENDEYFIELVNKKYNVDIRPWYFIFCLLHEVGHHMTLNELTEEDLLNDLFLRQIVIPNIENEKKCGQAYINLIAEDLATSWAIDYIDSHLNECAEIQERFLKVMKHYSRKKSCR